MTFILNFHGIGDIQREYEDGESPYWIDEGRFRESLDMAQASEQDVVLTFDDGNASDYHIAFPELVERGMKAIFFVLAGKIGQTGYLRANEVQEIDAHPLMQIGSHGMDHLPWPDLKDAELTREIAESKQVLNTLCKREISAAGLPFGRYDKRVLNRLKAHDFTDIYSSDGTEKLTQSAPLPRFSVRSDTDMAALKDMIMQRPGFAVRAKNELRARIKAAR